jgi:hypothetical protein
VPIPTSVSAEVLGEAKQLAQQAKTASQSSPLPSPRMLRAGEIVEGKLSLSSAEFFYVQVSEEMSLNGFVLACRTRRKNDRFRILVFDERGDEAQTFDTYKSSPPPPPSRHYALVPNSNPIPFTLKTTLYIYIPFLIFVVIAKTNNDE